MNNPEVDDERGEEDSDTLEEITKYVDEGGANVQVESAFLLR